MMAAGVVASSLLSIVVLPIVIDMFMDLLEHRYWAHGTASPMWVMDAAEGLGLISAGLTLILGLMACRRYAQRREERGFAHRRFETTLYFSIVGGVSGGSLMWGGTNVLGHIRPTWMELSYTLPAAIVGFLLGSGVGLLLDFAGRSRK